MSTLRVLWLSNKVQTTIDAGLTGTWLDATAEGLVETGEVALANIAVGRVSEVERRDCGLVQQWVVPSFGFYIQPDGLPARQVVDCIKRVVEAFSPDILHVWGTEQFWGLLSAREILRTPTLLEIQGLKGQVAGLFYGGLTLAERMRCVGIRELIKRRTMRADRSDFARWGIHEKEIIRGHRFVDVQSSWVAAHVKAVNPDARLFPVDYILRLPFYDPDGWRRPPGHTVFCSASYSSPFKGLHVAIRALSSLKKRISDARLRIAGVQQRRGIRQDGYMRWINHLIRQLGLTGAIDWLGPLNAQQLVAELKSAAAIVIPSFIETYCLALAEAMIIGTPAVASYAGGLPSLAKDEESCLFFPPGDAVMCAHQLSRLLENSHLSRDLSVNARRIASARNDRKRILTRQLQIYRAVLGI